MNVMLPRLIEDFHSKYNTVQWTVTGYVLAQAAGIPLAGWLSDRYGAKRIFLLSIGWFALGWLDHWNPLPIRFVQGSLVLVIAQFAFFGTLYLIAQFLQIEKDFGAFKAGAFMIPYAVASGRRMISEVHSELPFLNMEGLFFHPRTV